MHKMYCNNCGKRGHVFKVCTEAIISCGIILVDRQKLPTDPETVRLLMVRRKDSMAYTEFLRGKYEIEDTCYIKVLLSNMTLHEHSVLSTLSFDELWTLHWGAGRDHHSHEFENSKAKFNTLDIVALVAEVNAYIETEWGFPKGRRTHREFDMDCAIREFGEETNIDREAYVVCKNLILTEAFNGTNGVPYKHIYFIAILKTPKTIDLTRTMTSLQKREVSAIEWKTIAECRGITRPHYSQRSEMLDSLERILRTFDAQDNIAFNQE